MLTTGIKGRETVLVTEANSAKSMGSGLLDVFATPAMTALMEMTAWKSVAPYLGEGAGTVGTRLDITHDAPTPLGMGILLIWMSVYHVYAMPGIWYRNIRQVVTF